MMLIQRYVGVTVGVFFVFLLTVGFMGSGLWAAETEKDPAVIAQSLQASYDKITSLQASFHQEIYSRMTSRKKEGSGKVVLVKPGLMRWDYETPDTQVFVCDGKRLSMYFAKENQMLSSSAQQYLESDVMYSFFAGTADVARDFVISAPLESEQDIDDVTYQIRLVPKVSHPQIDEIEVWVNRSSYLLHRIKVVDKFGSITDLTFSNIIINQSVPSTIFTFVPPEGTEIIDQ